MGEAKRKKKYMSAQVAFEYGASVSVFKIILICFLKFFLTVLRVLLFPFGLVWLWGNMLRENVYRKYS